MVRQLKIQIINIITKYEALVKQNLCAGRFEEKRHTQVNIYQIKYYHFLGTFP